MTLAFAAVMGFTVWRMNKVRQQLVLINKSYLRLTLILGEFAAIQGSLLNTVADRANGRRVSKFLLRQVDLARRYRLHDVERASALVEKTRQLGHLAETDRAFLDRTSKRLQTLGKAFRVNEALFDQIFSRKRVPPGIRQRVGDALLRTERKLGTMTRRLRNDLRGQVRSTGVTVQSDQRTGVWAGLGLVVLALLFSIGVTWRARRTLQPLKTLVEGARRIASGDYAGRVNVQSHDELGELAGEFNAMARAVEERETKLIRSERMAAAGRLASHITHEVRNPLNSISLNTEMLEEEIVELVGDPESEPQNLCRAIRQEVDRLTDITEEYLRFARLPAPNLQEEDLSELLSSLVGFLTHELEAKGITIERDLSESLPAVLADENQLRMVFLNLVRNAGEAMADDGGILHVETHADGDSVVTVIADTGAGMDAETLAQIFEPFFSTKEHGTGLGLALTHQIIGEHNGTIAVDSEPGRGTRFTVSLPACGARDKVAEADDASEADKSAPATAQAGVEAEH
ncbi:MAG: HAMP domain-containing protein [Myxococcales bacterium]|nr:HAMP domain-containing protein [Myxococcales bacterium]